MGTVPDRIKHLQAGDMSSLNHLQLSQEMIQSISENGAIPIGVLGMLVNPDHYSGPKDFESIIDLGDHFEGLRGIQVPESQRWTSRENRPANVHVIADTRDEIVTNLHNVTRIARDTGWPNKTHTEELTEYARNIREVIQAQTHHFLQTRTKHSSILILESGALFLKPEFPLETDQYIHVNAKRLDMHEHSSNPDQKGPRTMKFGLTNWRGLEKFNSQKPVDLVVPDDCISTSGSIQAGIIGILQKSVTGEFPPIRKITVYAAVGVQRGIEDLLAFGEEIHIPLKVVVGAVTYAYTKEFYLRRMAGEPGLHGEVYTGNEQVVSDMGWWLMGAVNS